METILFLLTSGRMRAFIKRQDVRQLKYRGAEDMPCGSSADLRDFVDYMLHEEDAEPKRTRLFLCCDTPRMALWGMTLLEEMEYLHFSLASLDYCLPIFLRTQRLEDCRVRFEEKTWRIADGLATPEDDASGKCPQVLTHRQLAEMFFYEEESGGRPKTSRQEPPTLNPLGRYVESSKVTPKHSL